MRSIANKPSHNAISKIVTTSGKEYIKTNYELELLAKLIEVRCPDYTGPTLPQVSHVTLRPWMRGVLKKSFPSEPLITLQYETSLYKV